MPHDSFRLLDTPVDNVTDYLLRRAQGRLTETELKVGRVVANSAAEPTSSDEYPDENIPGD